MIRLIEEKKEPAFGVLEFGLQHTDWFDQYKVMRILASVSVATTLNTVLRLRNVILR